MYLGGNRRWVPLVFIVFAALQKSYFQLILFFSFHNVNQATSFSGERWTVTCLRRRRSKPSVWFRGVRGPAAT